MACIESNQESIPQLDSSILNSFLDDSQVECCDDERLRIVIQSLEAAINPILTNDQSDDYLVFDEEQVNRPDQSCAPETELDFSWMDVEMFSPSSSSSSSSSPTPSDDISWYDQVSGDELDMSYMIEYDAVNGDYSEIPMEMEEHIYSSLWQENYDLQGFETCRYES